MNCHICFPTERPRRLLAALMLALTAIFASVSAASAQVTCSSDQINEFLKDKGKDWLKHQVEDWVFDTGYSETMHSILDASAERADGNGNDANGNCQGAVMGLASSILHNESYKWNAKTGAHLAFTTLTKTASLAIGGLGAAAEGGALDWLAGQYTGAAADGATDAVADAVRSALIGQKKPQFEIYESSGTIGANGRCTYTLRAVWDIARGTYKVYISGDCHCQPVGNVTGVIARPLGHWWISFEGRMKLVVDDRTRDAKWVALSPKMDFDAQCGCGTRPLRTPFPPPPPPPAPQPVAPGSTPTPTPVPLPPIDTPIPPTGPDAPLPPDLPKAGQHVCPACQPIQDQIDMDQRALNSVEQRIVLYEAYVQGDLRRLAQWQQDLAQELAYPGSVGYGETPAQLVQWIANVQQELASDTAEVAKMQAQRARLIDDLVKLGKQLADCCATRCSSTTNVLGDILSHVSVGFSFGGSHGEHWTRENQQRTVPTNDRSPQTYQPMQNSNRPALTDSPTLGMSQPSMSSNHPLVTDSTFGTSARATFPGGKSN